MSDPAYASDRRPPNRSLFLVSVIAILAIAAGVYFYLTRDASPKALKLALVTWTEDPFWDPLIRGAQDSAAQLNVELTVIRSKPTVEAQNANIHDLLAKGFDGIAVSPNDATAQMPVLNEIAGKAALVTFDTDAPDSMRRRFVGIDNYAAGQICASEIREALPDGGAVLISVGSVTQSHGRDRRQGLIDSLVERGFDRNRAADALDAEVKGPKYTIVSTVTDGGDPVKAATAIADALKAHPEVKGVVGLYSYSAPAILTAMKQAGVEGKIKVVGFDDADETQAGLQAGSIHASILQDTYRAGSEAVRVLADEVRGVARGPAEQSPVLNIGINVLTADNVQLMRDSKMIRPITAGATTKPVN